MYQLRIPHKLAPGKGQSNDNVSTITEFPVIAIHSNTQALSSHHSRFCVWSTWGLETKG